MTETKEIERLSTPYARAFMIGFTIVSLLVLLVFFTPYFEGFRLVLAYALPLVFLAGIVLAARIFLQGRDEIPQGALIGVWIFSIAGVALDAGVTIAKTPTLAQEANVIARFLLDTGHTVGFVCVYGILSQSLYLVLVCGLWAAFLRFLLLKIVSMIYFMEPITIHI